MSATTWFIIAIVGFSLAGIAFIGAVVIFFKMNIPAIIGDLSGKTVAREVKAMKELNTAKGDKRFRSNVVDLDRRPLNDNVDKKTPDAEAMKYVHASKRLDKEAEPETIATEVLQCDATEVLESNATEVLSDGTTVLEQTEQLEEVSERSVAFKVVYNQIVVHTEETI